MVRIQAGKSWKLNPEYRQALTRAGAAPRSFSPALVLDALGIEVDGTDLGRGLSETAIFEAVDQLVALTIRLCREPGGGGQVSLAEGAAELVLGRKGSRVAICLVTLGRPARLLAGEMEVELAPLAEAVVGCARSLLGDLEAVEPRLARSAFARALERRVKTLQDLAQFAAGGRTARAAQPAGPPERLQPRAPRGLAVGFTLFDEDGRLEQYRRGADLFALLGPGELLLRDASGDTFASASGKPFLLVTELVRAAGDLVRAIGSRADSQEVSLGAGAPALAVDLQTERVSCAGRRVECPPALLAQALLQGAADFCAAVAARNPALAQNPYLASLSERVQERLAELQELAAGELFETAEPGAAAPARKPPSEPPLAQQGNLKRLRFRATFEGVDLGGRVKALAWEPQTLSAIGARQVTWLNPRSGEVVAVARASTAVACEDGVILSRGTLLEGFAPGGAQRFMRDAPGRQPTGLSAYAGMVGAESLRHPAALCVLDGYRLAAVLVATGRIAWQFSPPNTTRLTAAASGSRVFVAADSGMFYGLESATGRVAMRVRPGCVLEGPIVVGRRWVAAVGRGDLPPSIVALDRHSGRPRLRRDLAMNEAGAPQFVGRLLLVPGEAEEGSLVAGYASDGSELFRTSLGAQRGVPALLARGNRVFAALRDGSVCCLSSRGELLWRSEASEVELERAVAPLLRRHVLIAAGEPTRALDPATGATYCTLPRTRGLSAIAVGPDLSVVVADEDGIASGFKLATHLAVV